MDTIGISFPGYPGRQFTVDPCSIIGVLALIAQPGPWGPDIFGLGF